MLIKLFTFVRSIVNIKIFCNFNEPSKWIECLVDSIHLVEKEIRAIADITKVAIKPVDGEGSSIQS